MFESVLYQLLAGYLGYYVKDINREHFRLGLWTGEALLENVEVRLEAFDYLQLPFAVKQGFVGKLRLQVPWSRLGRDPILIALEDVTLLAGPHEESEYGAEASERRALAAKKADLASAEIAKLSQRVSEDKSGQTFLSYLSAKIIDNVQVTVTNLHIRYMDGKTDPERDFCFGITLASLTIRTTDGRGYPAMPSSSAVAKGGESPVHKLVHVQQFAVYWNSKETHGSPPATSGHDNSSGTRHSILGTEKELVYLLQPTTATLRLTVDKRSMSGGPSYYSAAADIDNLSVAVADQQLVQMLLLVEDLSRSRLRERYARFRPQINQVRSARGGSGWKRQLWTFAIQAVLSDVRKHHRGTSWSYFSWRSEQQKRYVGLYKEKLEALQIAQPAVDPKWADLEEMERDFDVDEILYFRSLAENQIQLRQDLFVTAGDEPEEDGSGAIEREDKEQQQEERHSQQHVGQHRGWLNWLSMGLLGAAESVDAAVSPDEIIKDLWETVAGFSPTDEIEARDPWRGQCRFMLSACVGGVVGRLINSSTKAEIVNIFVGGTSVTFALWQESSNLSIRIPTLEVVDPCKTASQFSCILGPKAYGVRSSPTASVNGSHADDGAVAAKLNNNTLNTSLSLSAERERSVQSSTEQFEPFLKVEVEINNNAKDFEVIVNVTVQPLQFVYSSSWLEQVVDFFNYPISLYMRRDSLISASEKLESIARHTRAKAEFAFATRKRIGWRLDVQYPTFIFPDDDTGPGSMLMIWAWESLLIVSVELQSTASSSADMAASRRLWSVMGFTRCYERLEVYLIGVQAVIIERSSNWYEILKQGVDLESHLVERFDFRVALCCLPSDPTEMTYFKISGEATSLRLRLSSGKCSTVKGILTRLLERVDKIESTENHEITNKKIEPGHVPATMELNLSVEVFTVLLYADGQSGPELLPMTLIAQSQNLSIRYTQWSEQQEMHLTISKFHIKDANELAGSSLRYLLFSTSDQSSATEGTLSDSEDLRANSLASVSNKSSLLVKFCSQFVDGTRTSRLDLSLRGLECGCHPEVLRTLYRFMNTLTVAKTPVASGELPPGVDGQENAFKPANGASTAVDFGDGVVLVLGLDLKDATFHLPDPGGTIAILKVADANTSVTFPSFGKEVTKVVAVLKGFRVKGPRWASGNDGGDPFGNSSHGPAAVLNITALKTRKWNSLSEPKYNVVEIDIGIENTLWVMVNDYFAVLIGFCLSSEWNFGASNAKSVGSQDLGKCIESVNYERTICIFRMAVRDSVVSLPRDRGAEERMLVQIPHLVVSFTPAELGRLIPAESNAVQSSWNPEGVDAVQIKCEKIAILFRGSQCYVESQGGNLLQLVERIDGKATIKVPNPDFATESTTTDGIFKAIPTKVEIFLSILHLNMTGPASREGIELLTLQMKDLSSITWKCKSYAAMRFHYDVRDQSPFLQLQVPPIESNSPLNLQCTISELIVFIKDPQESLLDVARLRFRKLIIHLSLDVGALRRLKMELLNLDLQHGSNLSSLLHLGPATDSTGDYASTDNVTPLLLLVNGALHLALPCVKLWFRFAAWSRVIMALVPMAAPARDVDAPAATFPSLQYLTSKIVERSAVQFQPATESTAVQRGWQSNPGTTEAVTAAFGGEECSSHADICHTADSSYPGIWPIQVQIGIMNVLLILPDYVEEAQPRLTRRSSRAQRLRIVPPSGSENCSLEKQAEKIRRSEGNTGKQIILSWSLGIDEIKANEGSWSVKACIMQAEAAIEENFCKGQLFHMHFLQATDLGIIGNISSQHPVNMSFTLQVDYVDAWCSYNTLLFLNKFQFEPFNSGSSTSVPSVASDLSCTLDLRLQSCSLLLSDSRWSCNAPIIETLLGKVFAQVAWKGLDIDVFLSSELEINYHNIQKVTWEPLMETWTASYKYTRVHNSSSSSRSRPFRTKSELISSASLNLNVTEALIQAISRVVEMLNDSGESRASGDVSAGLNIRDSRAPENSSMRRYAPYWLQNDTGVPLYFWICGAARKLKNDEDAKCSSAFGSARKSWGSLSNEVVQPGCSVPLYVEEGPEEVFSRQRAGHAADMNNARKIFNMHQYHRMICIQLEGTARPSVPISIDLVGSVSFEAVFSDGDSGDRGSRLSQGSLQEIGPERTGSFSTPVILEVTVQRYSKLVRLSSMVSLVNTTSTTLELRFDIPFLISPKVLDPILPGQVMALPVHLAETGRMRWRPLGNNHLWSDIQLLPNLLQLAETRIGYHRPVVCYPFHPSNGAFRCCIAVENCLVPAAQAVATSNKNYAERRDFIMGHGTGADYLGSGICTGSDSLEGCTSWEISIQAPLVMKNCLPCSLSITIETSAGATSNISAPEGDSVFLYDIDTAQDLNMIFLCPTFLPITAKIPNAAAFSSEVGRNVGQDMKVTTAQELHFISESTAHASVTVEMEAEADLITGAREVRVSAPFWIYNCSYLNLSVMDGDVDLYSGKELPLGGDPSNNGEGAEEMALHSTGSRFWPSSVNGLQVLLDETQQKSTDTVVKRPARITSELLDKAPPALPGSSHLSFDEVSGHSRNTDVEGLQSLLSVDQQEEGGDERARARIFMYSPMHGTDASEMKLRARVLGPRSNGAGKESEGKCWSRPFSLEPPGGTTTVTIPQVQGSGAFVVAVISAPALGSCAGKTKTVTFRPRFLLANASKQVLCYKQQGTDKFQRLTTGKHSQLHLYDVNREFLVSIRIDEHGWDWSGGFAPDHLGDTQVKVRNHTTGEMQMLRIEVSNMLASTGGEQGAGPAGGSLGTYLILISDDETGFMPYRIENFTLERLRFHQQKCAKMENMLQPYSSCRYAWDEPCRPHRLVVEVPGAGELGAFWLDEVKEYPVVHLPAASEKIERRWLINVRAEGPIRVLSVVDGTVHTAKPLGGGDSGPSGEQLQDAGHTVESSAELAEEFVLKFSSVGISVMDSSPQEVIYACARGLRVQLLQGQHQQVFKLDVSWFQVDNQLRHAIYPVMLSVARVPPDHSSTHSVLLPQQSSNAEDDRTTTFVPSEDAAISFSVAKWCNPAGSVDCFQCIQVRLEPLRLELEERVVSRLLQLMEGVSWNTSTADSSKTVAFDTERWSVVDGGQQYGLNIQPFATALCKYEMVHSPESNTVRFIKLVTRVEVYRSWASAVAVEQISWHSQKLLLFAKERRKAYIEMLHVAPIALNVSFSSAPWLADEFGGAATRSLLWMTGTLLQRQVRALADVEGALIHLRPLKLAHPFASWDVIRGMIIRHYTRQLLQEFYKVLGSVDVFGNPVGFIRNMASGVIDFVSAPTRSSVRSPTELVRGMAQGTQSLLTNTVFAFSNAATRMSRAARKGVTLFTMESEYDHAVARLLQLEGSQDVSVVNEFLEGLTGLLQAPIRGAEKHGLPGMLSGVAWGAVGVIARPVASILEVAGMTAQSIRNRSRPAQWHAVRVRLPRHVHEYSALLPYSWERAVGQAVLLEAQGGRFMNEVYFTCKPLVQDGKLLLLTDSKILTVSSSTSASNAVYGSKWELECERMIADILYMDQAGAKVSVLWGPPIQPLTRTRTQHQPWGSSKYAIRSTAFAHETFILTTARDAEEVLELIKLLEERQIMARSKLLFASSASISSPDFLDLDKFF